MASVWCALISATIALSAQLANARQGLRMQQGMQMRQGTSMRVNPIRRVVTMLQDLHYEITEEQKREDKCFEDGVCACKGSMDGINAFLKTCYYRRGWLQNTLAEEGKTHEGLLQKMAENKRKLEEARQTIAEQTALREKEAAIYAAKAADSETNIAALKKAIKAIEDGHAVSKSFLQTGSAAVLKKLSITVDISDAKRDTLASFLSGGQGYTPQSGEILGILKQIKDTMVKDFTELKQEEASAQYAYEQLMRIKNQEVTLLTGYIEKDTKAAADLALRLSEFKEELTELLATIEVNEKLMRLTVADCNRKTADYEAAKAERIKELAAISDAIKILTDDDALDTFKKAIPSPAFLQMQMTNHEMAKRALSAIKQTEEKDNRLNFISLALRGKQVDFKKVLRMIDVLVKSLKQEQKEENEKKVYCEKALDEVEDTFKQNERDLSLLQKDIQAKEDDVTEVADEIEKIYEGIADMKEKLKEAEDLRNEEFQNFLKEQSLDTEAKDIISKAKERVSDYYLPKKKSAAAVLLQQQEDMAKKFGVPMFMQVASGYNATQEKKSQSAGEAIIAMLDTYILDLEKSIKILTLEEKDAQKEFDDLRDGTKEKTKVDMRRVATLAQEKADTERERDELKEKAAGKLSDMDHGTEQLQNLNEDCKGSPELFMQNFKYRMDARRGEIESLKSAKQILTGADFSLLQIAQTHKNLRR